jgi:hypothetical protein
MRMRDKLCGVSTSRFTRSPGFYWVKSSGSFLFRDQWQVAYWSGHNWHLFLCETDEDINDNVFSAIDENRLIFDH